MNSEKDDRTNILRTAISLARRDHEVQEIAEAVGYQPTTLTNLITRGLGGPVFIDKLWTWCDERGYIEQTNRMNVPNTRALMARQFRNLADVIESESDPEFVAASIVSVIGLYENASAAVKRELGLGKQK